MPLIATRLYLIRHGETSLSGDEVFGGSTDVDLNERGRRQISCLASRLAPENITAVYCSDLRRAIESASIIAEAHQLTPQIRPGLREIHHGQWQTKMMAEIAQHFPDEYAAWQEDPFTYAPPGGESGLMVLANTLPVIREIVLEHSGESVAVVCHETPLKLIIGSILGIDLRHFQNRLVQSPGNLNIVEYINPVTTRLLVLNDISHYSDHFTSGQGSIPDPPGKSPGE